MCSIRIFGYELRCELRPILRARRERRDRQLVRDYKRGCPVPVLAKRYDLSEVRINQILFECGARQPKWRKIDMYTRAVIFDRAAQGYKYAEIGREVGVSRERIRQILNEEASHVTRKTN